jgi:hypothetical protein
LADEPTLTLMLIPMQKWDDERLVRLHARRHHQRSGHAPARLASLDARDLCAARQRRQ